MSSNELAKKYDSMVKEFYWSVHTGKINAMPVLPGEVVTQITSQAKGKEAEYIKHLFSSENAKRVNKVIGIAKRVKEDEFITFMTDPERSVIKLSPSEMELLVGGGWGDWLRLGIAVCSATAAVGTAVAGGAVSVGTAAVPTYAAVSLGCTVADRLVEGVMND